MASSPEPVPEPVTSNQSQRKKEPTAPKKFVPPTLAECHDYALERFNLNGSFSEMFHEHYENTGWVDKSGKPYQNWKNLMRVWVDKRTEAELAKHRPKVKPDNSQVHR